MNTVIRIAISVAAAMVMASAALDAADQPQSPAKREIIPGSELMTPQERERYRQRIRNAGSPEAEQKVRADHVSQMRERARLRGLRLPETSGTERDAK
jgi:hypothetical protein